LVARRKLVEQIQAQERLVRANSEYVRLARLQYNGGYSPYSTVLQAEQQLFPSELNYAQYRAALFVSLVNIYKAMGGGWQAASELTAERN
jgi:multidrug efflux system outer membrane protein